MTGVCVCVRARAYLCICVRDVYPCICVSEYVWPSFHDKYCCAGDEKNIHPTQLCLRELCISNMFPDIVFMPLTVGSMCVVVYYVFVLVGLQMLFASHFRVHMTEGQ